VTQHNPETAALTWVRSVTSLASTKVATTLPDPTGWAGHAAGFVTVSSVSGGPLVDIPVRPSRIQVSAWATLTDSQQVPWRRAAELAEEIVRACQVFTPVSLTPGSPLAAYDELVVMQATALTDQRRVTGDPARHARYDVDVALTWR
jgi:hypothetical protein